MRGIIQRLYANENQTHLQTVLKTQQTMFKNDSLIKLSLIRYRSVI